MSEQPQLRNPIIAKRVTVLSKTGGLRTYTHVTLIQAENNALQIAGEADEGGVRANVGDTHKTEGLHVMIVEFYKPRL